MANGIYTVTMSDTTVSSAVTLVQLNLPATCMAELLSAYATQRGSTTNAQQRIELMRVTTVGSGSVVTPIKMRPGGSPSSASCTVNNVAEGTAGDILHREAFSVLTGFFYRPVPEERILVEPSGRLVMKFPAVPTATTGWQAGFVWREIG